MKDSKGRMRRVRKRYVDVVARIREDGSFEPLSVAWRDGRSFKVTEIVEAGEFRPGSDGYFTARYRIRIEIQKDETLFGAASEPSRDRPAADRPLRVHEFE